MQITLRIIETEVNNQLDALSLQQDRFIKYYTALSVQTIQARLNNAFQYSDFAARAAFMNTLFNTWDVSDDSKVLQCTDFKVTLSIDFLDKLRTFGQLQNSLAMRTQSVSAYFTSDGTDLSQKDKEDIFKHIGKNINALDYILRNTAFMGPNKSLGVLLMLILRNPNKPDDYKGIFFMYPGTCGDVDLYKDRVSRLV